MFVVYKMKAESEQQKVLNVITCGMLANHEDSLYIRFENGIESFIPLLALDWYSVKPVKAVDKNEF